MGLLNPSTGGNTITPGTSPLGPYKPYEGASTGAGGASGVLAAGATAGSNYPNATLPSWLTTNPDSLQTELAQQYKTAPASILAAGQTSANLINRDATIAYGQNVRQGANATQQQTNVARQQGGTARTSSIVAGQMTEDATQTRTSARVQAAQVQQQATDSAASLSSQIAGNMAQLRSSYLSTLAGTNDTLRGQNMNYSEFADTSATAAAAAASKAASTLPSGTYTTGVKGVGAYLGPIGTPTTAATIAAANGTPIGG